MVENLASWGGITDAGNFIKYAAMTANDLPVDSHELMRSVRHPLFISAGSPNGELADSRASSCLQLPLVRFTDFWPKDLHSRNATLQTHSRDWHSASTACHITGPTLTFSPLRGVIKAAPPSF
jgi:hypothetical protein